MSIYNHATEKLHDFLCINKAESKLYHNFEHEYRITEEQ